VVVALGDEQERVSRALFVYHPRHITRHILRMVGRKISMAFIAERIYQAFGDELHVIHTDDNADKLVLRIRLDIKVPEMESDSKEVGSKLVR